MFEIEKRGCTVGPSDGFTVQGVSRAGWRIDKGEPGRISWPVSRSNRSVSSRNTPHTLLISPTVSHSRARKRRKKIMPHTERSTEVVESGQGAGVGGPFTHSSNSPMMRSLFPPLGSCGVADVSRQPSVLLTSRSSCGQNTSIPK